MTDEEIVKRKYPDADYHEESKWWESGVWRKGIVPILLGKTWQEAREAISKPEGTICPNCLKADESCNCSKEISTPKEIMDLMYLRPEERMPIDGVDGIESNRRIQEAYRRGRESRGAYLRKP